MIILGLAGAGNGHAAAALLVDQTLVAAMDEASLSRVPPSPTQLPWAAARFCLQQAGIAPSQVDAVAIAAAPTAFTDANRWHYAARLWDTAPLAALDGNRHYRTSLAQYQLLLTQLGLGGNTPPIIPVEPVLAHASAGYYLSGHPASASLLSFSEDSYPTSTLLGRADNGHIQVLDRLPQPDGLMRVMLGMGAYLGFDAAQALEGIALLARHGDAKRYDLGKLLSMVNGRLRVNLQLFDVTGRRGWQHQGRRYPFTPKLVDWLGPSAVESPAADPHVHYAAALQQLFAQTVCQLLNHSLKGENKRDTPLLIGGDAADSRTLIPQMQHSGYGGPLRNATFTGATGAACGAAARVAARHGILPDAPAHSGWGPGFCQEDCIAACRKHPSQPAFEVVKDVAKKAARLLAEGHAVGWFQGRAESMPLPLGARALLYSPTSPQRPLLCNVTATGWTPVYTHTLGVTATNVSRYSNDTTPTTFGNRYQPLLPDTQQWLPADLQINGCAPLHAASKKLTPRFHALLEELEKLTGHGMVVQMPLKLADTPRACSPADALDWLVQGPANYLAIEDLLIKKLR